MSAIRNRISVQTQAIWAALKEKWAHLSAREKEAMGVGGAIVAIFIIYQFIWLPLINQTDKLRKQVEVQQKTLAWMESADQKIKKRGARPSEKNKTSTPVALLSVLQQDIYQAGLKPYLTQLKQSSHNAIAIHFQKIPFDKMAVLLIKISNQQDMVISQFSVTAEESAALVNAEIFIEEPT